MNTKIQLKKKHTIPQLEKAVKESCDERQKMRLRVLTALRRGMSRAEASRQFLTEPKAIRSWIRLYNEKGIKGLILSEGGRPKGSSTWDRKIFTDLTKELDKQDCCWSLALMREWINENKEQDIPESTIWYHLQLLEYSYKSVRPHPYLGDKDAQEEFKKGA